MRCLPETHRLSIANFRLSDKTPPVVTITLGEYQCEIMNTMKPRLLQVDDMVLSIIRHWLVPLIARYTGASPSMKRIVRTQSQESSESVSHLQQRPHWFLKTRWSPILHGWEVKAKSTKKDATFTKEFLVDRVLKGLDFSRMKATQWRLAAEEWNNFGGTKRE